LSNSRDFLETSYFIEAITSDKAEDEERARQIYISGRKKRGRPNVHTTSAWLEYKARLGLSQHSPFAGRRMPEPMSSTHFQAMEKTLLTAAGLHPRVIDPVMRSIAERQKQIEAMRRRQSSLQRGIIRSIVLNPIEGLTRRFHEREFPKHRVVAAIGIIADTAVLFTTRQWNVVGTLSYPCLIWQAQPWSW
jgi:hypothetical protein